MASAVTAAQVRATLAGILDPHTGASLAESGEVRAVGVDGDRAAVESVLGYPADGWRKHVAAEIREKLEADPAHPVHVKTVWGAGYRLDP